MSIHADVATINRIASVPRILDAVVDITGMRFAAVARVTETTWTACAVRDDLEFGLSPGGSLELETTICNEIRQHQQPVAFGQASAHAHYSQHHTPKRYGLESYVSVPILRLDGSFFGTLCAIDSRAADLDDPAIIKTLTLFAELIGHQLEMEEELETSHQQLIAAERKRELRDELIAAAERDFRDLFQPIVTGLYLLRTSPGADNPDQQRIIAEMDECCGQITHLLRAKLDQAYGRITGGLADGEPQVSVWPDDTQRVLGVGGA